MNGSPDDNTHDAMLPAGIDVQKPGFAPAELISCSACSRPNSPNRATCIYCGAEFRPGQVEALSSADPPELWEKGFNVIAIGVPATSDKAQLAAKLLGTDEEFVRAVGVCRVPLPVARTKSCDAARKLITDLQELPWECIVVPDEDLRAADTPHRLSGIEFDATAVRLRLFNAGTWLEFPFANLSLVVGGNLVTSRINSEEKRKSRGRTNVVGEFSTITSEPVMDLYMRDDLRSFRINSTGFDFSCLNANKSFIVAENFANLRKELARRCPALRVDAKYDTLRGLITPTWDVEVRKETSGIKHVGLGRQVFASTSATDNRDQFTRYSRLMWYLHEKQQESS